MSSIPESAASEGADDACDSWTKVEADDEEQSSEAAVSAAEKFEMRYMLEEEDAEDPAEEMPDEVEWPTITSDPEDDEQGLLLLSSPAFSLRAFNLLRMGENKKTQIEYIRNRFHLSHHNLQKT